MFRSLLSLFALLGVLCTMSYADDSKSDHECALNFQAKTIDGESVDLESYEGNVVLIVNVASQCGYTSQYAGLQEIYDKYKEKGFTVLAFPCNQFGGQEPGTEADIKQFCTSKYNVTFPMFSKVDVKGDDAAEIYQYLTSKDSAPAGSGEVSWNFEKFLVDRDGQLIGRYKSRVKPTDAELTDAIEAELNKGNS